MWDHIQSDILQIWKVQEILCKDNFVGVINKIIVFRNGTTKLIMMLPYRVNT